MSKFDLEYTTFYDAYMYSICEGIDPQDFINCENEEDLQECFYEFVISNSRASGTIGTAIELTDVVEYEGIEIPERFLEEWRELKAQQNND